VGNQLLQNVGKYFSNYEKYNFDEIVIISFEYLLIYIHFGTFLEFITAAAVRCISFEKKCDFQTEWGLLN